MAITAPFALSACGTSFDAQTNQQYQAADGANLRTGPIHVYNGLFVDNGDGRATFSGALLSADPQEIVKFSVNKDATTGTFSLNPTIQLEANELKTLGPGGEVIFGMEGATAGTYVTVTFESASGDVASLEVPIVERTEMYDDVSKTPVKKKATPKTKATEKATESASE